MLNGHRRAYGGGVMDSAAGVRFEGRGVFLLSDFELIFSNEVEIGVPRHDAL